MAPVQPTTQCASLCRLWPGIRRIAARRNALLEPKRKLFSSTATVAAAAGAGQASLRNTIEVASPRRSGNYEPSSWTEFLLSLDKSDGKVEEESITKRISTLKANISSLLKVRSDKTLVKLMDQVDSVQRLGLGYHFKEEIKDVLNHLTNNMSNILVENDMHATALLFRLLREDGYDISEDIFSSFIKEDGSLAPCVSHDIKGLLSLYEASFYSFDGELILEKARQLSSSRLMAFKDSNSKFLEKEKIIHALENPIHWMMPRLYTRWFIDIYGKEEEMHHELLELAKLDFVQVQRAHQRDLKELSDWWTRLGLAKKLPFARDRLVELYMFAIGMQFEPKFGYLRVELTKVSIFITVIDDIYDIYGNLEELQLFTETLERWDVSDGMVHLPYYMKVCFMALFNNVNELAFIILRDKGINVVHFLKNMWVNLCKAYLVEARWYHGNHIPTLTEYLKNASVTIANSLLMAYAYVLLGEDLKPKNMESITKFEFLHWSSIISRLVDDLGTTKQNEKERGDVAKAMECYMHHEGVSKEVARINIFKILHKSWKMANRHRFEDLDIPQFLIDIMINHTRTMRTIYSNGDGIGFPKKIDKDRIMSLLVE